MRGVEPLLEGGHLPNLRAPAGLFAGHTTRGVTGAAIIGCFREGVPRPRVRTDLSDTVSAGSPVSED